MVHLFAGHRGPVTVMRSFDARPEERARALARFDAQDVLRDLLGDAARHELVGVAELDGGFGRAGEASSHDLVEQVARAIDEGTIIVVSGWERGGASYAAPPPARREEPPFLPPERAPSSQEQKTWFAVQVIDEVGDPVAGLELTFELGDGKRQVTTAGDGTARVDGVPPTGGAARLPPAKILRGKLDERWTKERAKDWRTPPEGADVFEVTSTDELLPLSLAPEVVKTIVLEPPYRVRLLDDKGKAQPNLSCVAVLGSERRQLKTDGQGWVELLGAEGCHETVTIEWKDGKRTRRTAVAIECHEHHGEPGEVAIERLRNHGYPVDDDLAWAVTLFQLDHGLELAPLDGDQIPQATLDYITKLWEDRHA